MRRYKFFDDPDDWFSGTNKKTKKSKGSAGGKTSPNYRPRPTNLTSKGINNIASNKKIPQAFVKISGSSKGADKAQAHLNYIGRKGNVEIEDDAGNRYKGDAQKELLNDWVAMGMPEKNTENNRKEAFHIVFSMPKDTNAEAMKTAVKNLINEEFSGHKYFLAQHLDTENPHCHVLLSATDDRGARLNPRKQDLHNYRIQFVHKLAEQGIESTASRRIHRFKYQDSKSQNIYHRDKKNGTLKKKRPTSKQFKSINKTHDDVKNQYQAYIKNQKANDDVKKAIRKVLKETKKKNVQI